MNTVQEIKQACEREHQAKLRRISDVELILHFFVESIDDALSADGRGGLTAGELIELMRAAMQRRAHEIAHFLAEQDQQRVTPDGGQ